MPPELKQQLNNLDRPWFWRVSLGGGVLLFLVAGWVFWHGYYTNPQRVFWSMVNNNLALNGVTKQTSSNQSGSQLTQTEQISLGSNNIVHIVSTAQQTGDTIKTETIGTPTTNYNRYLSVQTTQKSASNKKLDFTAVLGKWSQQAVGNTNQGAFSQALYDVVPISRLNSGQRRSLISFMQQNQVYNIDFSKVTRKSVAGQSVLEYPVQLSPAGYAAMLKQLDQDNGVNQLGSLDVGQYEGSSPVPVTVDVNPVSHQLVRIVDGDQTETFDGYGVSTNTQPPSNAVAQTKLEALLSSILSTP